MVDFGKPLCADVVEGGWGDDGEADQEDIRLWVGKGAQSIVILLTSSIPQTQANWLPVYHNTGRVVVEDRGDVLAWEGICGV